MLLLDLTVQDEPSCNCQRKTGSFKYISRGNYFTLEVHGQQCSYENVNSLEDIMTADASSTSYLRNLKIIAVAFSNSRVSQFSEKLFQREDVIRRLVASNIRVEEIGSNTFQAMFSWDTIDFSNNNIKKLDEGTFTNVDVTDLDLSNNQIKRIEVKAFMNATILSLNLSLNQLSSLEFLDSFRFFKTIHLNENLYETFNLEMKKDFWNPYEKTLQTYYRGNEAQHQNFHLENNKFDKFNCRSNTKIESIILKNNPTLTDVALDQCEVDLIDISGCKKFKKFSFNDKLSVFTAKNVNLEQVNFSEIKSLKKIAISNSSVGQTTVNDVLKMENLNSLDLSYVKIGLVNTSTFAKLKSLEYFFLKATNISNISVTTFSHLRRLRELDISDNHLGVFDGDIISTTYIRSLDISGNDLTMIENLESGHSANLRSLHNIDLSGNKWPCSYLMQLLKFLISNDITLTTSNLEEEGPNIRGVACFNVESKDDLKEPMTRSEITKKIKQLESKESATATLDDKSKHFLVTVQMNNSALLENSASLACLCCTVLITMKIYVFVRKHFLKRPKQMRATSERNLAMSFEDF